MCGRMPAANDENGKILRPADNSWHQVGPVDLVATAESGKLQLDGAPIQAEQRVLGMPPDVGHARSAWCVRVEHIPDD